MKNSKQIIALIMAVIMIFSITACGEKKAVEEGFKYITTGYGFNAEGDYDKAVAGWKKDYPNAIKDEFHNLSEDGIAATPGNMEMLKDVDTARPMVKTTAQADSVGSVKASGLPESNLTNDKNLNYLYKGKNYAYGITTGGGEFIAFMDDKGNMFDVFNGAGKFIVKNVTTELVSMGLVESFEETEENGVKTLSVKHRLTGFGTVDESTEIKYIFRENSISVVANIKVNSKTEIASGGIRRAFINGTKADSTRVNVEWCYPENGDQPYQVFDSLTFRNQLTDTVFAYTYVRSEGLGQNYVVEGMNGTSLPMHFKKGKSLDYTAEFDISFVDTATDRYHSADYLGIFRGYGSDFAAGIGMVSQSGDDSTVFVGDSAKLNINVTNLLSRDLKYSLKYDVRDYYGNVVDEGIFIDNQIKGSQDVNRTVEVKDKYGIYYLNLYVVTENCSWREFYPFALLEEYDYKYFDTAVWNINSVNCNKNNKSEWVNSAKLMIKVGSSSYRTNTSETQYWVSKELMDNGVTRFLGGAGLSVPPENLRNDQEVARRVENMMPNVDKLVEMYDIKWIQIGNEFNMQPLLTNDVEEEDRIYRLWYQYVFEPSRIAITEKYPQIQYIPTSDSACSGFWLERLTNGYMGEDGKLTGVAWEKVDTIATHIYGHPHMPDTYSDYEPEYGKGLWHIEAGMQRMFKNLTTFNNGDPNRVDFLIPEVGYEAPPEVPTAVDYRTQADYIVRIGMLCPAYSADVVSYYCMYDRTSYNTGISPNHEFYFGLFFEHDYYGIVKPKPSGVAFGVMTRQLESYKKDTSYIDEAYDEGYDYGGVRAFAFDTELHGKVVCAWSNQEVLPNGKRGPDGSVKPRKIRLPWETHWEETDPTVFKATGDTVKVVDTMGNATEYKANAKGEVKIPLSGSPVYIYGVK